MVKKVILSLICTLILCLGIFAYFYFFYENRTPINVTLNVVKLDSDGNEIGTAQICISGEKISYFLKEDRLLLNFESFDHLNNFKQIVVYYKDSIGKIYDYSTGFYYSYFSAYDTTENVPTTCTLIFTDEFDRLALMCQGVGLDYSYTYAGSVSGNYALDDIVQYFRGLVPGYRSS